MWKREQIENMTINELIKNQINVNRELVSQLFENPIIRDLPEIASLYGFYSRFVVGQKKVFFVYGLDADVINGKFHEANGTVIPDYIVKKCGYFAHAKTDMNLRCPRCEVCELGNQATQFSSNGLALMEFVIHEYRKYQLPVPEYFHLTNVNYMALTKFNAVTDNDTLIETAGKAHYREQERQLLLDIAIWEWPITVKGKKPGFLAFCACSRYSLHATDSSKSMELYNHPRNWEAVLKSEALSDYHCMCQEPRDVVDFVVRGLKKFGIPYYYMDEGRKMQIRNKAESRMMEKAIPALSAIPTDYVSFYVSKVDEGAVSYLLCQYTKSRFTEEQIQYGNDLYYGLQDIEDSDQDPAAFLFYLPGQTIIPFLEMVDKYQIKIGYPDAGWLNSYYHTGVYLITEYSNMPVVSILLHNNMSILHSLHDFGIKGNTGVECRTFHQNLKSIYVRNDPWQFYGKNNILRMTPWCVPKSELLENGTMVDNNRPPLTSPVEKRQERKGRGIPFSSFFK